MAPTMISPKVSYELRDDGVVLVTIVNPPVNALHTDVYKGLSDSWEKANADPKAKAVVLTGKGSAFIAGADIKAFGELFQATEAEVRDNNEMMNKKFDQIEDGAKPWVAALNGVALGGGLEFAMMCSHRVGTPASSVGLPELQLGLIPGLGGTQRLPRLIGVQNAVRAMLESQTISSEKAHKLGVIDVLTTPDQLIATASKLALDIASGSVVRQYALRRKDKLENSFMIKQIINMAGSMATKTSPHMPQAHACLRAVAAGVEGPDGRKAEAAEFAKLGKGPVSAALINIFISQRATSKVAGVSDNASIKPRQIKSAAVVGGGLMGSGIATAMLLAGIKVVLKEVNQQFLDAGVERVKSNLDSRVKKGKMTEAKRNSTLALLVPSLTYDAFKDVDLVIEAVIEKVDLKQQVFVELEKACKPDCILATNTSTINIELIAEKTKAQSRVIGAHFFSPAHIMPLLEIVTSKSTSPQVVADLLAFAGRIKKTPVVVGNCPGFAVNRTFFPYTMVASFLADHGVDIYHIDKVIKSFGMPMGPFRLGDLVGNDVGVFVSEQYHQHYPDRTYRSAAFGDLVKQNRLGEKTGQGFYLYAKGTRDAKPDAALTATLAARRKQLGLPELSGLFDKDIAEIIFFPVINEACRILAEGFVQKSSDLDIASVFGMGFPSHLGGVIHWADQLTAKYVFDRLNHFHAQFKQPIFKPCEYLASHAASGVPLRVNTPTVSESDDDIVIIAGARTAIGRAKKGGFNNTPIDDLLAVVIRKVMADAKTLKPEEVGDVVVGSVLGSSAATQARTGMLLAGLPNSVPVRTVNRQCSSGLQSIADVAGAIRAGYYEVGIACGAESMSMNAMMPKDFKPNPNVLKNPTVASCYLPMGITSENVAAKFGISREKQDRFAAESHARAGRAIKEGKLNHIVPVTTKMLDSKNEPVEVTVTMDEGVREGTTAESLGTLKAIFKPDGSTTAGNASQTSDGASAVIVTTRRKAKQLGLKPLAVLTSYYVAGCDPSIMGIGPAVAIPGAVKRAGLTYDDIKVFEINEAFASQATYCVDKLGLPHERVNPNGGAIAIGHPLGMTGNRLTVDIIHELKRQGGGYGVVSMCIGTGMGAAAVFHVTP
eukprot:c10013_g1_i1.p1 GENE.c10013_g1_i1~~c10013_g1_i1.p1  ORF type:complete len:1126 (-),score=348.78 c10013_g1_i1:151-3486(-)